MVYAYRTDYTRKYLARYLIQDCSDRLYVANEWHFAVAWTFCTPNSAVVFSFFLFLFLILAARIMTFATTLFLVFVQIHTFSRPHTHTVTYILLRQNVSNWDDTTKNEVFPNQQKHKHVYVSICGCDLKKMNLYLDIMCDNVQLCFFFIHSVAFQRVPFELCEGACIQHWIR